MWAGRRAGRACHVHRDGHQVSVWRAGPIDETLPTAEERQEGSVSGRDNVKGRNERKGACPCLLLGAHVLLAQDVRLSRRAPKSPRCSGPPKLAAPWRGGVGRAPGRDMFPQRCLLRLMLPALGGAPD